MNTDEYRFFVTRVKTLEAENAALKRALEEERASFDVFAKEIASATEALRSERAVADARIASLEEDIKRYKRGAYYPGIILGGGPSRDGGVQAFGGLGWKINLW